MTHVPTPPACHLYAEMDRAWGQWQWQATGKPLIYVLWLIKPREQLSPWCLLWFQEVISFIRTWRPTMARIEHNGSHTECIHCLMTEWISKQEWVNGWIKENECVWCLMGRMKFLANTGRSVLEDHREVRSDITSNKRCISLAGSVSLLRNTSRMEATSEVSSPEYTYSYVESLMTLFLLYSNRPTF